MHELIRLAMERMEAKGKEHNNDSVSFASYCPFGRLSSSTLLHREALRVCVEDGRNNQTGADEHLIDLVVFAMLKWISEHPPSVESYGPLAVRKSWEGI